MGSTGPIDIVQGRWFFIPSDGVAHEQNRRRGKKNPGAIRWRNALAARFKNRERKKKFNGTEPDTGRSSISAV